MDRAAAIDPLTLACDLIRCPSVTPEDAGALGVLQAALEGLGFRCTRLRFDEPRSPAVDNLYARYGEGAPHFCFAGHSDVVPVGDRQAWTVEPFAGVVDGGLLLGRGAADMKGAIAAFAAAAGRTLADCGGRLPGSISLLITGDEEGPAINGTVKVLRWLAARGERIDGCLVGEPTNPTVLGEMVKIGRRGSLTGTLRVLGAQGHVAYPDLADNPVPRLLAMLSAIAGHRFDDATEHFPASNLEITTIDVGNPTPNVIPASATAMFNIRFNLQQTAAGLGQWLRQCCDAVGGAYELRLDHTSDPFLTPPGPLSELVCGAVEAVTGRRPVLSTTGGTSDARFIKDYCPVVEFGLVGQTMHKVDEQARVSDVAALADIYAEILRRWFAR